MTTKKTMDLPFQSELPPPITTKFNTIKHLDFENTNKKATPTPTTTRTVSPPLVTSPPSNKTINNKKPIIPSSFYTNNAKPAAT
ncbi:hypothetical protein ABG067_009120, partial [Albugo candida]